MRPSTGSGESEGECGLRQAQASQSRNTVDCPTEKAYLSVYGANPLSEL